MERYPISQLTEEGRTASKAVVAMTNAKHEVKWTPEMEDQLVDLCFSVISMTFSIAFSFFDANFQLEGVQKPPSLILPTRRPLCLFTVKSRFDRA